MHFVLTVYTHTHTHSKSPDTILTSCSCSFKGTACEIESRYARMCACKRAYGPLVCTDPRWRECLWHSSFALLSYCRKCICSVVIQSRQRRVVFKAPQLQEAVYLMDRNLVCTHKCNPVILNLNVVVRLSSSGLRGLHVVCVSLLWFLYSNVLLNMHCYNFSQFCPSDRRFGVTPEYRMSHMDLPVFRIGCYRRNNLRNQVRLN